jgi:predicted regulator of Ras-like GTPase activity (Roadblock/LC7/MglB family)
MIVTSEDGLVVADSLMEGVRGNAVAALTSSLIKHTANATTASGVGAPQFLHLQAASGVLLAVAGGNEVLVVAIAEPSVNVGLVRLELIRATEAVN